LRGSARRRETTHDLVNGPFKEYKEAGRVEIVEVADMTAEHGFDEAVKGVTAIIHTASPIDFSQKKYEYFIPPAIAGALNVCMSALRNAGPQLESIVLTSSLAAIVDADKPTHAFSEKDWNEFVPRKVKELQETGVTEIPSYLLYACSKTEAERALWKWAEENKPPFSLSAACPAVVYGAPVNLPSGPKRLNDSLSPVWTVFSGEDIPPAFGSASCVDVRDVADLHVWAATHPKEAGNQRYLLSAGRGTPQAIADILRAAYPDRRDIIKEGTPGEGYEKDYRYKADGVGQTFFSTKAEAALGRKLRAFDESILDSVKCMESWL